MGTNVLGNHSVIQLKNKFMLQFSKSVKEMDAGNHSNSRANSKSHTTRAPKIRFALLAALVIFGSCDKDKKNNSKFARMDMVNAKTLFIAPANSTLKSATDGVNRLFKITDDGIIEEVSYFDEDGNQINEFYTPEEIEFISNSDYFVANIKGYL